MQQQRTKQVADNIARDMAKLLNDRNTMLDERVTSLERRLNSAEVDAALLAHRVETITAWLIATMLCLVGAIVKISLT